MPRSIHRLTDLRARRITKPGRHADGNRLYLQVDERGNKSWVFAWKVGQKRRLHGLGSFKDISLAEARQLAREAFTLVRQGKDPIAEKRRTRAAITFGEASQRLFKEIEGTWRNAVHRRDWERSLELHASGLFAKPVNVIGLDDVAQVMKPLWSAQPESAQRIFGRIRRVLDWARAHNLYDHANPADWRLLKHRLGPLTMRRQRVKHFAAMHYRDVPAFMAKLRATNLLASRALEFLILTAARSNEIRGARWDEINLEARTWTVPAHRMKAGIEHVVPLSDHAMAILEYQAGLKISDYVFPGTKRNQPISPTQLAQMLHALAPDVTVHGFRSSFSDWAGDCTNVRREVAEAALAHQSGDETERSYRRQSALDKRRKLMELWAAHLQPREGNVIPMSNAVVG
jgi:integrase